MLTDKAIAGLKSYIDRTIVYARYKINGTYYKAAIHRREYLKDGRVAVYFYIVPQAGNDVTISEVQLFDTNNDLWATKTEAIVIRGVQKGVLYRFAFDIREV